MQSSRKRKHIDYNKIADEVSSPSDKITNVSNKVSKNSYSISNLNQVSMFDLRNPDDHVEIPGISVACCLQPQLGSDEDSNQDNFTSAFPTDVLVQYGQKCPEKRMKIKRKKSTSSSSPSTDTYYKTGVLANKVNANKNTTKPSSDIYDDDEFELNDTYEADPKKSPGSNTKDDDESSNSCSALYCSGCCNDWVHNKSRKLDIHGLAL